MSPEELERYSRHILLKEIGGPGQARLAAARVLLVGAGGLGSPAAVYLAAAGVGALRIVDPDRVSLSNLQRQVLFRTADVGRLKIECAVEALSALNPGIEIEGLALAFDPESALSLVEGVDLILDGTDSFSTRRLVNAVAHEAGKPVISGAVGRWDAQIALFASGLTKGRPVAERAPCYACLYRDPPPEEESCAILGIVGALTGVAGSIMALEAIKTLAKSGQTLLGRLLIYDGLGADMRVVRLNADPACPVCGDP